MRPGSRWRTCQEEEGGGDREGEGDREGGGNIWAGGVGKEQWGGRSWLWGFRFWVAVFRVWGMYRPNPRHIPL